MGGKEFRRLKENGVIRGRFARLEMFVFLRRGYNKSIEDDPTGRYSMALIQVALEVPDDVYVALLNGDLIRRGGVVRDAAGQIVVHLKEVGPVDEEAGKAVAAKAAAMAKQNKALLRQNQQLTERAAQLARQNKVILIGVGVVAAAAAVGGAIVHVVKGRKEKEAESLSEVEKSFNAAMKSYLDSLRKGKLNEEVLAAVVANVDEVKTGLNDGTLTIDFTDGQLDALVTMLKDYTERLAAANGMELAEPTTTDKNVEASNMILLSHYLGEQQRILQAA